MAVRYMYNAATKAGTASTTTVFYGNELPVSAPGAVVSSLIVTLTGTSYDLSCTDRYGVKAAGEPIVDLTGNALRAFIERFSRANLAPATSGTAIVIPFYIPDGKGAERYACGAPYGKSLQLEITNDATSTTTPLVQVGWSISDQNATLQPRLIGQVANIGASLTNARFNWDSQGGAVRGFGIVSAYMSRVKVVISNREECNLSIAQLAAAQALEGARTITTDYWHKVESPIVGAVGSTYLELDTAGSHSASDQFSYYAVLPQ